MLIFLLTFVHFCLKFQTKGIQNLVIFILFNIFFLFLSYNKLNMDKLIDSTINLQYKIIKKIS